MLVFSPLKGFKTCHAFSQAAKLDRGERLRRQPAVEAQEASQQTTSQLPKASRSSCAPMITASVIPKTSAKRSKRSISSSEELSAVPSMAQTMKQQFKKQ